MDLNIFVLYKCYTSMYTVKINLGNKKLKAGMR